MFSAYHMLLSETNLVNWCRLLTIDEVFVLATWCSRIFKYSLHISVTISKRWFSKNELFEHVMLCKMLKS